MIQGALLVRQQPLHTHAAEDLIHRAAVHLFLRQLAVLHRQQMQHRQLCVQLFRLAVCQYMLLDVPSGALQNKKHTRTRKHR